MKHFGCLRYTHLSYLHGRMHPLLPYSYATPRHPPHPTHLLAFLTSQHPQFNRKASLKTNIHGMDPLRIAPPFLPPGSHFSLLAPWQLPRRQSQYHPKSRFFIATPSHIHAFDALLYTPFPHRCGRSFLIQQTTGISSGQDISQGDDTSRP